MRGSAQTFRLRAATAITGLVAIAASATLLAAAPVSAVPAALAPGALCKKLTPAMVSKTLGVKATAVTKQISGTQTVCWYTVGGDTTAVFVRGATAYSMAKYTADKKLSASTNQHPKADTKFGKLPAFSSSLSSPVTGTTYSVTVLKGTTEIQTGASKVSLAKVEALAKAALAFS
jgi:hypothetical protein